jgi:hypothetical protein
VTSTRFWYKSAKTKGLLALKLYVDLDMIGASYRFQIKSLMINEAIDPDLKGFLSMFKENGVFPF